MTETIKKNETYTAFLSVCLDYLPRIIDVTEKEFSHCTIRKEHKKCPKEIFLSKSKEIFHNYPLSRAK